VGRGAVNLRASLPVLSVGLCPEAEQQLCRVSVSQRHGVEERCASVAVYDVNICSAEGHQRL
jgi:hypothetical protein